MTKRRSTSAPRVVVIGGGFGGLNAVRELARAPVRVTIIDRRNHHLFQPLLYQVASAALDPSDIAYPIRTVFRRQKNVESVLMANADAIDVQHKTVTLDDGRQIPFDKLIVATGATHSYFGNESWAQWAPGLKTIEDALEMRRRILEAFEAAERDPDRQRELLTFVVVGAGPTGVELAGALREIAVDALAPDFRAIDPRSARVLLIEGDDRVLPVYPRGLSASARSQLEKLGVEVRTESRVTEIDAQGVTLDDGSRIDARTVLWAAGVRASKLGAALGRPVDRVGRVRVNTDLSVPDAPDIFVVGDLATIESDGSPVPGVAPAAIQAGRHAARQIRRDLRGQARQPFRYRDKGSLATIGKAHAVANLGVLRFGGFWAWMAWMTVHVFFLVGFRNRLFVLLSWAWSYLSFGRGARLITGRSSELAGTPPARDMAPVVASTGESPATPPPDHHLPTEQST